MANISEHNKINSTEYRELQCIARIPVSLEYYLGFVKKLEAPNAFDLYPELAPSEIQSKDARMVFAASMRHQAFWRTFNSDKSFSDHFGITIPEEYWDAAAAELAVRGSVKLSYDGPYFVPDELKTLLQELPYYLPPGARTE